MSTARASTPPKFGEAQTRECGIVAAYLAQKPAVSDHNPAVAGRRT